jgi:hypothetical protein
MIGWALSWNEKDEECRYNTDRKISWKTSIWKTEEEMEITH